jgi:haloacetate dehalogenase
MRALGHKRFAVVGHDRDAWVAYRMALDHPDAITRMALLNIVPTSTMYAHTDKEFATRNVWWFFLVQPTPLPEKMINADRAFFLRDHIEGQLKTTSAMEPEAFAEYLRCYDNLATVRAVCEDYRAAASVDLVDDAEDAVGEYGLP